MVIWIIGLSGAGKTTLANLLKLELSKIKNKIVILDGDEVRTHFNNDLGHSLKDRRKNAQRIINFCKLLEKQGITTVVPILHNFVDQRKNNRKEFKNYFEVYIKAKKKKLIKRNYKKIYSNFKKKRLKNVVGFDLKFNPPANPDLILKSENSKKKNLEKTLRAINFRNLYFYDNFDYRENKFIYAYSNITDDNFLKSFHENRNNFMQKYSKDKKIIPIKKKYQIYSKNLIKNVQKIYRNFEISKKIKNQNGTEINIEDYVKISILFTKYLQRIKSLKVLNCFLKLNDYILFRLKKNNNKNLKNLFIKSIKFEKKLINSYCNEFKIKY